MSAHLEMLQHMLKDPPRLETEDAMLKLRVEGERYWVVGGVELYGLLEARKYVLSLPVEPACSCPSGTYNPGSPHEPYCRLSEVS